MTVIRDRRDEPFDDKYIQDKLKFIDLVKDRVRQALREKIANDTLDNLGKGLLKVPIPKDSIKEPYFHFANDGDSHSVFPVITRESLRLHSGLGFDKNEVYHERLGYDVGDTYESEPGGGGGGGAEGDPDAEDSLDDFIWLNEEEIKDILFEGRKLPDMLKLKSAHLELMERAHSGYTNKGPAHRMDAGRTNKKRRGDEIVLSKVSERRILQNLSAQFGVLTRNVEGAETPDFTPLTTSEEKADLAQRTLDFTLNGDPAGCEIPDDAVSRLSMAVAAVKKKMVTALAPEDQETISRLEGQLTEQFKIYQRAGNFRDRHLTYEYDDDKPKPNAKAVMFCLMDVSGSMDQELKNTAKVFFWLLKEFLKTTYDQVDIVFIAHTTTAKEVDEKNFFYGQETGGTIVSSCLQKTKEIIAQRYPASEWNIYSGQASDGDNWSGDNPSVEKLMEELLPQMQAHYYVEVVNEWRAAWRNNQLSELGHLFEKIAETHKGKVHVAGNVASAKDALDAFGHFFPVGGGVPKQSFMPGAKVA